MAQLALHTHSLHVKSFLVLKYAFAANMFYLTMSRTSEMMHRVLWNGAFIRDLWFSSLRFLMVCKHNSNLYVMVFIPVYCDIKWGLWFRYLRFTIICIHTSKHSPSWLCLVMLKLKYCGQTWSISWLLMPWLLVSPGHQQQWYWLCKIHRLLSSMQAWEILDIIGHRIFCNTFHIK